MNTMSITDKDYEVFKSKTLLLTGGTGTLGTAVIKKLLQENVPFKEIRVFSRDENKQFQLSKTIINPRVSFHLGDVRDKNSLINVMNGVDIVIHAAALKHVGMVEKFPMEAIKTNVLGTKNVIDTAMLEGVEAVICISSDKAVYPINSMGLSKAFMEKVTLSNGDNEKTKVLCIRLGNVLGSRGSVVPVFLDAIKQGEDLIVNGKDTTRFIMTVNDVIDTLVYALKYGRNGEIIIHKMNVTSIRLLAEALLEICGEKLSKIHLGTLEDYERSYECLMNKEEMTKTSVDGDYFIINRTKENINVDSNRVDSSLASQIDKAHLKSILEEVIREIIGK